MNQVIDGIRVCHPFGNPFAYNAAIGFHEAGQLIRFYTSLYRPLGLSKRCHPELPSAQVITYPLWEAARLMATRLPFHSLNGRQQRFVDFVASGFDRKTASALRSGDRAVYCYEDSALVTFRRAEELGIARIYELPILHYREMRRIFTLETARQPELTTFFQSLREPAEKLERKDQELLSADVIVVPSTLVRRSIEKYLRPKGCFAMVPYGVATHAASKMWTRGDQGGPVKLFFAGILGPRKGLHVLFEALSGIPAHLYQLSLGGRWVPGFREWLQSRFRDVRYEWLGQLPHASVYETCRRSDVFVFPSLAEGFGLVILEAMASGIPVIASTHTAGPDVIEDGVNGWIVSAGDPGALRSCIEKILDERKKLPEMGAAARRKAETLDWRKYRAELRESVSGALAESLSVPR